MLPAAVAPPSVKAYEPSLPRHPASPARQPSSVSVRVRPAGSGASASSSTSSGLSALNPTIATSPTLSGGGGEGGKDGGGSGGAVGGEGGEGGEGGRDGPQPAKTHAAHSSWSTNGLRFCCQSAQMASLRARSRSSTGSASCHASKSVRLPITLALMLGTLESDRSSVSGSSPSYRTAM